MPLWHLVNYFAENTSVHCRLPPLEKRMLSNSSAVFKSIKNRPGVIRLHYYYNGSQNSTIFPELSFFKAAYSKEPKSVTSFN